MVTKLTGTKRQSYIVSDKVRISKIAQQQGNRAAEIEFRASEKKRSFMAKKQKKLKKMPRLNQANRGKKSCISRTSS